MYGYSSYYTYNALNGIGTAATIIFILALIASIVMLIVFLPESKKNDYHGFVKKLYNFLNFHNFWMSAIIKVVYMTLTIVLLLLGIYCLFINFGMGLGLIISAVLIRLIFELSYIFYAMRDQLAKLNHTVDQINQKMNSGETKGAAIEEPAANVCPGCGATLEDGQKFCSTCGTKID